MSFFIDMKYLRMLPLQLYEEKNNPPAIANFRCPVCGDSEKSASKKRGWALHKHGNSHIGIHCHNCSYSETLSTLIKEHFPYLYEEYLLEILKERHGDSRPAKQKEPEDVFKVEQRPKNKSIAIDLPSIKDLPQDHHAKQYIISRKIPDKFHSDIYYSEHFNEWADKHFPDKIENPEHKQERIVFPLRTRKGDLFGVNARILGAKGVKYKTLLYNNDIPKIYGLDRIDMKKTIYIVEGPIDSLFIENCVACIGGLAGLQKYIDVLGKDLIVVADNEKRNSATVKNMENALALGLSVFIPPSKWKWKDINEAIKDGGLTQSDVYSIINENVWQGKEALVKLTFWRRS